MKKRRKHSRDEKAFLAGTLVLSVALMTGWALNREEIAAPEGAPMDEVIASTTSTAANLVGVTWDLPVTRNEHVDDWIGFLKGRNAEKTELWLERSGRYTPMIQAELRSRGMPEDLIYLAFIESGYSPNAKSHAAAVGLWQFIAETGQRYGLEVSPYVDERRDPLKSTEAALEYLTELHERFGSWYLAAASYNTGENRVARIMRETTGSERGTDADFWRIAQRLPAETRNYVPLMLAAGHIGKEPAKYGFTAVEYHEPLAYETVRVPPDVPLAAVAKATGMDLAAIESLNPALVRSQTPPTREWNVKIPVGTDRQFALAFPTVLREVRLAGFTRKPEYASAKTSKGSTSTTTHRVKVGETLSEIAQKYRVSVAALVKANGGLLASKLQVGQTVRIPKGSVVSGRTKTTVASKATAKSSSKRYHSVRSGDSLSEIADKYNVSVTTLKRMNGIRGNTIRAGQKLRVA